MLALFVPFPRLGIEERSIRIPGGDKLEDPHTLIAAGLVYFLALTFVQVLVQRAAYSAPVVHVVRRFPRGRSTPRVVGSPSSRAPAQ